MVPSFDHPAPEFSNISKISIRIAGKSTRTFAPWRLRGDMLISFETLTGKTVTLEVEQIKT